MIRTESITINNTDFDRTYSDAGFYIKRDGVKYSDAVDPKNSGRTYTETDERIEVADE